MERIAFEQLQKWKDNPNRKPLIVQGARQVGKTWLLKEFARRSYQNIAYISCENSPRMQKLFADYDTMRIIRGISALTDQTIIPGKTLIFIDEIQEIPKALSCLKYFCENQNEYHIVVAGSLLGVALHQGESFPVGKVDVISLYPMTFEEFLCAMGKDKLLAILQNGDWNEICLLGTELTEYLRMYYFTGGMPEAVYMWTQERSTDDMQKALSNIISASIKFLLKN